MQFAAIEVLDFRTREAKKRALLVIECPIILQCSAIQGIGDHFLPPVFAKSGINRINPHHHNRT
jgi:hypothetical protein